MTKTGPKSFRKRADISEAPLKPVLTVMWMILPVFLSAPAGRALINDGHSDWISRLGITPASISIGLEKSPGNTIAQMMMTSLAQLSPAVWVLNSLFVWILGSPLERKLRGWRFPVFLTAAIVSGWLCISYTAGFRQEMIFIGPSMLLFGFLGGYFAFFPKRPFKPQQWVKSPTEIFKKEVITPNHERYWVSPWLYIIAFLAYQTILQVGLSIPKDQVINLTHMTFLNPVYSFLFGRMTLSASAFSPVAAMFQIVVCAIIAQLLPMIALSLKPKRPGGNLQLEVIQHYRELRTLDMTHEQASEGAAKFAAVPIDVAKDWIAKGAAGLKDQNLNKQ